MKHLAINRIIAFFIVVAFMSCNLSCKQGATKMSATSAGGGGNATSPAVTVSSVDKQTDTSNAFESRSRYKRKSCCVSPPSRFKAIAIKK